MIKLPSMLIIDRLLQDWLLEDIGRGDCTTEGLFTDRATIGKAIWVIKEDGVVAGLPFAARVFQILDNETNFLPTVKEGEFCHSGTKIATIEGTRAALLTGERVALNLGMRLSGIATATRAYLASR